MLDQARLDVPNAIDSNGEIELQRAAMKLAKGSARPVFLDVGSNTGQWLARLLDEAARQGVDSLEVHAFEPSPSTYAQLLQNTRGRGVNVNRLAMSDQTGEATLFEVHPGAGSNSLYERDGGSISREVVPTSTVDSYCARLGIDQIVLMKSDAEGHDMHVLRGARRMLEEQRITAVQFEYNHRWISGRSFLRDAFEYLKPLGYSVGKLTPRGIEWYPNWDPELETFREGNYVAQRPERPLALPHVQWWKSNG